MNKIRINQGRIVMWQFRIAGTLFVFFIGAAAFLHLGEALAIFVFIGASMLLPPLWSSYSILEINPTEKLASEYTWIAGIKMNNEQSSYTTIEKIFINPVKMAQTWHSYSGAARTNKSLVYHAFLKLNDEKKIFLLSSADHKKLKQKLLPIAKKLNCDLTENF